MTQNTSGKFSNENTRIKNHYSFQKWTSIIQERNISQISIREWCNQNGVLEGSFYNCLKRIRDKLLQQLSVPKTETKLQEVSVKPTVFARFPNLVKQVSAQHSCASTSTVSWIITYYHDWLSPITKLLHEKLLEQSYLHVDESPVQVLNEPGRKNTTDSYMWVYSSIKESKQLNRIFEYQLGRSGKYPEAFLKDFTGFVYTDAYKGYEKVSGITRCLCWSYLRRYFVNALPKDIKSPETTIPSQAITYINKLFEIEKKLEVLSGNGLWGSVQNRNYLC